MTNKTMNKKMSKRQKDIKSKLMAAICMLLVSSIMMVSTTYAWFTLSTAPEVTGITTAVGANGNLEMALIPATANLANLGDPTVIKSAVGDSMANQAATAANITWGNLVDLETSYGLENITLFPAGLKTTTDRTSIHAATFLERPVYGTDGRVKNLAETITGTVTSTDTTKFDINSNYGVRAIGTSSSMSERELTHRTLLSNALTNMASARNTAAAGLSDKGQALADIAIRHINNADSTFGSADVEALDYMVDQVLAAVSSAELALKNYMAANAIATAADDTFAETRDEILDVSDITTLKFTATEGEELTAYQTAVNAAIDKIGTTKTNANQAKTELGQLTAATGITWTEISTPMAKIADTSKMTINGVPVNSAKDDISGVISGLNNKTFTLTMSTDSGAFADIADLCGNYSATVAIKENTVLSAGGTEIVVNQFADKALLQTAGQSPTYLANVASAKADFTASAGGTGAQALSDYYGYIVDLAFRTNASDSFLQLQTEAANRIYSDSQNADIMGAGSSMSFTSADTTKFTNQNVMDLMEHIRIVFFETDTNLILAYGFLDTDNADVDGNEVTAKMYLADANFTEGSEVYTLTQRTGEHADELVELTQNVVKAVSVLVYLDGHTITNADVANAAKSMTGSMNLQFSSSAELMPMDYSDLKNGTGTAGTEEETRTVNMTNVKMNPITASATDVQYVEKGAAKAIIFKMADVAEGSTLSVNVGGVDCPATAGTDEFAGYYYAVYTGTEDIGAATEVTITVTAPATDG